MVVGRPIAAPGTPRIATSPRYAASVMFPGWAGTPWLMISAPQRSDGRWRQIVRVDGHASGKDQKVSAMFQMGLCRRDNHSKFIVTDGNTHELRGIPG